MSQTVINATGQLAEAIQAGSVGTLGNNTIITATNSEASAEMRFGIGVKQGATDDAVLLLTAITDDVKGIIVFGHGFSRTNELGTTGLKPKTTFGLMRRGFIWVLPEGAVTTASGVHIRALIGAGVAVGGFLGAADGTNTRDITAFARWHSSGSGTVPALLEFDFLGM